MLVSTNDRYEATVIVGWLRRCQEDEEVANYCYKCPYAGRRCISNIQGQSADLIEKFATDQDDKSEETVLVISWLRKCCNPDNVRKWCNRCPFDDGEHNCIDYLHIRAAELLESLVRQSRGG